MNRTRSILAALCATLTSAVAFAQEVAATDADLASGWQTALSILAVAVVPVCALAAWALVKLAKYLGVKTGNETVAGIILRLAGSIGDAVAMVGQTVKQQIKKAKAPGSPGGEAITDAEGARLVQAVWDALTREYGSLPKVFAMLREIGLGEYQARAKINTMIEAAVASQKAAGRPQ